MVVVCRCVVDGVLLGYVGIGFLKRWWFCWLILVFVLIDIVVVFWFWWDF